MFLKLLSQGLSRFHHLLYFLMLQVSITQIVDKNLFKLISIKLINSFLLSVLFSWCRIRLIELIFVLYQPFVIQRFS